MLPRIIDQNAGDHAVLADRKGGRFHVLFVSRRELKNNPFHPHWVRECASEAVMNGLIRWFAARRDRWQEWGDKAEAIGIDAFWDHMEGVLAAEPLALVQGVMVRELADPYEVGIGELLIGKDGPRCETLYVHRFASVELCASFLYWYRREGVYGPLGEMVQFAWSYGTDELGDLMEEVTAQFVRRVGKKGRLNAA